MRRTARHEPPDEEGLPRLRRSREEVRKLIDDRLSAANDASTAIAATRSDEEGLEAFEKWRDLTCNMLKAVFDRADVGDDFSGRVSPRHVVMSEYSQVEQIAIPGLKGGVAFLETLRESLDFHELAPGVTGSPTPLGRTDASDHGARVFVVHGRDSASRLQVQQVLGALGLEPIVLMDEPAMGRTIIEKFEQESRAGFAVVVLTGDDEGGPFGSSEPPRRRARQNVILELGYFLGKLGRPRVCALLQDGVEVPSDIHGVEYVPLDSAGAWKYALADELDAAGYQIDRNRLKRGR
ncbi:MAG: hypothetical protein HMLKMBBP_00093 [Planctomycetes bacterium]|nr:hypothetical protein [Planctomycetota bacterium]